MNTWTKGELDKIARAEVLAIDDYADAPAQLIKWEGAGRTAGR